MFYICLLVRHSGWKLYYAAVNVNSVPPLFRRSTLYHHITRLCSSRIRQYITQGVQIIHQKTTSAPILWYRVRLQITPTIVLNARNTSFNHQTTGINHVPNFTHNSKALRSFHTINLLTNQITSCIIFRKFPIVSEYFRIGKTRTVCKY